MWEERNLSLSPVNKTILRNSKTKGRRNYYRLKKTEEAYQPNQPTLIQTNQLKIYLGDLRNY